VLLQVFDIGLREFERQQVGIGEVTVIVRLFLGTHRARFALDAVEQPRLLIDRAAILDDVDLPARLDLDRLTDEADRIDVLDFAARAKLAARLSHRNVDIGAQVALFHVAVAGAQIAQDGPEFGDVGLRLLGRAHVGLGHDFHQGNARAIEIDVGIVGMLVVQRFAGVLLKMEALDADAHALAVDVDLDFALADHRLFVLRDLIALRQIRVEVVLAVEHAFQIDLGLETQAGADRLRHALLVDHRQHARHRRIDQRNVAVGLGTKRC